MKTEELLDMNIHNGRHYLVFERRAQKSSKIAGIGKDLDDDSGINIGQVVSLDQAQLESYYGFYDQEKTGSPFFAVTLPDGSVKNYVVRYVEVS